MPSSNNTLVEMAKPPSVYSSPEHQVSSEQQTNDLLSPCILIKEIQSNDEERILAKLDLNLNTTTFYDSIIFKRRDLSKIIKIENNSSDDLIIRLSNQQSIVSFESLNSSDDEFSNQLFNTLYNLQQVTIKKYKYNSFKINLKSKSNENNLLHSLNGNIILDLITLQNFDKIKIPFIVQYNESKIKIDENEIEIGSSIINRKYVKEFTIYNTLEENLNFNLISNSNVNIKTSSMISRNRSTSNPPIINQQVENNDNFIADLTFTEYETGKILKMDNLILPHSSMRINIIFIPKIVGEINLNVNLQSTSNDEIFASLNIKSVVFSTEFENNQLNSNNNIRNILVLDEFGKQTISKLDFGEFFKGQTTFKLITLRNQSSTDTFDVFLNDQSYMNNSNNNNSSSGGAGSNNSGNNSGDEHDDFIHFELYDSNIHDSLLFIDNSNPHLSTSLQNNTQIYRERIQEISLLPKAERKVIVCAHVPLDENSLTTDTSFTKSKNTILITCKKSGTKSGTKSVSGGGSNSSTSITSSSNNNNSNNIIGSTSNANSSNSSTINTSNTSSGGSSSSSGGVNNSGAVSSLNSDRDDNNINSSNMNLVASIKAIAHTCTSIIEVSPCNIKFGDSTIGDIKFASVTIYNRSDLSTRISVQFTSKVITCKTKSAIISPHKFIRITFRLSPRRVNPKYRKQITIVNESNKMNEQIIEVESNNIDRNMLNFHCKYYDVHTTSQHNFAKSINFGVVALNGISISKFQIANISDEPITLRFKSSSPNEISTFRVKRLMNQDFYSSQSSSSDHYNLISDSVTNIITTTSTSTTSATTTPTNNNMMGNRFFYNDDNTSITSITSMNDNTSGGGVVGSNDNRPPLHKRRKKKVKQIVTSNLQKTSSQSNLTPLSSSTITSGGGGSVGVSSGTGTTGHHVLSSVGISALTPKSPYYKRLKDENSLKRSTSMDDRFISQLNDPSNLEYLKSISSDKKNNHQEMNNASLETMHYFEGVDELKTPISIYDSDETSDDDDDDDNLIIDDDGEYLSLADEVFEQVNPQEYCDQLVSIYEKIQESLFDTTQNVDEEMIVRDELEFKKKLSSAIDEFKFLIPCDQTNLSIGPTSSIEIYITYRPKSSNSKFTNNISLSNSSPLSLYSDTGIFNSNSNNNNNNMGIISSINNNMNNSNTNNTSSNMSSGNSSSNSMNAIKKNFEKLFIELIDYDANDNNEETDFTLPPRELTIQSKVCQSMMEIAQKNINFGSITNVEDRKKTITISNASEVPLLFRIKRSGSIASNDIKILDMSDSLSSSWCGIVRPYGSRDIQLYFKPSLPGVFNETLTFENVLDESDSINIIVKADIRNYEKFTLKSNDINFGNVLLNQYSISKKIVVTNMSKNRRIFETNVDYCSFSFCKFQFEYDLEQVSQSTEIEKLEAELEKLEHKFRICVRKNKSSKIKKLTERINEIKKELNFDDFTTPTTNKEDDSFVSESDDEGKKLRKFKKIEENGIRFSIPPRMSQVINLKIKPILTDVPNIGFENGICRMLVYENRNTDEQKMVTLSAIVHYDQYSFNSTTTTTTNTTLNNTANTTLNNSRTLTTAAATTTTTTSGNSHQSNNIILNTSAEVVNKNNMSGVGVGGHAYPKLLNKLVIPSSSNVGIVHSLKSIQIVPNEIDLGINSIGEKIKCKLTISNESKTDEAGFVILDSTNKQGESYQVQYNIKNGTIGPCKHENIELTCEYYEPGIQIFSIQIQDLKTKIIHKCLIKCRVIVDSPIHIENVKDRILNFGFCYISSDSENISKVSNFQIKNTKDYSLNLKLISNSKKQVLIYSDEYLQNLLSEKSIIKIEPQQSITIYVGLKPFLNNNLAMKGKCISFSSSIVLNVLNEEKQIFSQVIQIKAFVGKSILNIDHQFIDFGWSSNLKTFNSQFTISNGNHFLPLEYEIVSSSPNELYLQNKNGDNTESREEMKSSPLVGILIGCKINSSTIDDTTTPKSSTTTPITTNTTVNTTANTNNNNSNDNNSNNSNQIRMDGENIKTFSFTFNPLRSGLHDHYFTIINKSSPNVMSKIAIRAFVDDRKSLRNNLQADSSGVDALVFSNVYVVKEQDENDQIIKITGVPHQHLQKLANQLVEEYDYLEESDEELRNEIKNSTILGVQEFLLSNISKNDMILIPNSDVDMIVFARKKNLNLSAHSIQRLERIEKQNSFTQYPNKGKPFILPAGEQLTLVTMLSGLPLTMTDNETENLLKKNFVGVQRSLILSDDEQRALKLINVHIQMGISQVSLRSNTISLGKIGYIDQWSDRRFQIVLNNHSEVLSKVKLVSKPKEIEFLSNLNSINSPTMSNDSSTIHSTNTINSTDTTINSTTSTIINNNNSNTTNIVDTFNNLECSKTKWTIPPKGQKTIICILKTSEFKDYSNEQNDNLPVSLSLEFVNINNPTNILNVSITATMTQCVWDFTGLSNNSTIIKMPPLQYPEIMKTTTVSSISDLTLTISNNSSFKIDSKFRVIFDNPLVYQFLKIDLLDFSTSMPIKEYKFEKKSTLYIRIRCRAKQNSTIPHELFPQINSPNDLNDLKFIQFGKFIFESSNQPKEIFQIIGSIVQYPSFSLSLEKLDFKLPNNYFESNNTTLQESFTIKNVKKFEALYFKIKKQFFTFTTNNYQDVSDLSSINLDGINITIFPEKGLLEPALSTVISVFIDYSSIQDKEIVLEKLSLLRKYCQLLVMDDNASPLTTQSIHLNVKAVDYFKSQVISDRNNVNSSNVNSSTENTSPKMLSTTLIPTTFNTTTPGGTTSDDTINTGGSGAGNSGSNDHSVVNNKSNGSSPTTITTNNNSTTTTTTFNVTTTANTTNLHTNSNTQLPILLLKGCRQIEKNRYEIELRHRRTLSRKTVESKITLENPTPQDVKYRIYTISGKINSQSSPFTISHTSGLIDQFDSHQITFTFKTDSIESFTDYIVIENLNNPLDFKTLRTSLEILSEIEDPEKLFDIRIDGNDSLLGIMPIQSKNSSSSNRNNNNNTVVSSNPQQSSTSGSINNNNNNSIANDGEEDYLRMDLGTAFIDTLIRHRFIDIVNLTSDTPLEFFFTSNHNIETTELHFSLSLTSLKPFYSLRVEPKSKTRIYLLYKVVVVPSPVEEDGGNSSSAGGGIIGISSAGGNDQESFVDEFEIFIKCKLLKDYQRMIKVTSTCVKPQMYLTKQEVTFIGNDNNLLMDINGNTIDRYPITLKNLFKVPLLYIVRDDFCKLFKIQVDTNNLITSDEFKIYTIPPESSHTIVIQPILSELTKMETKYIEEHLFIYNYDNIREKKLLTIKFSKGLSITQFYSTPGSKSSPVYNALEDRIVFVLTKFRKYCEYYLSMKNLEDEYNNTSNNNSNNNSSNNNSASSRGSNNNSNNIVTIDIVNDILKQKEFTFLYYDIRFLTDELVFWGLKGNVVGKLIFDLANLLYISLFKFGSIFLFKDSTSSTNNNNRQQSTMYNNASGNNNRNDMIKKWIGQLSYFLSYFHGEEAIELRQLLDLYLKRYLQ